MLLSQLAEKFQLDFEGPDLDILGITSINHPQDNKVIPFLDTKKITQDLKNLLATKTSDSCFLVAKELYSQIQSEYPNRHTWILGLAHDIKEVFISLLMHFDTYHIPKASVIVLSHSGEITASSRKKLADIGSSIGEDVFIGPQVVIGENTVIESGVTLLGQNYIGYGVTLGRNTLIHPQVTIHNGTELGENCIIHSGTVLGSDGFGYELTPRGFEKIPQIGNVVIGNSVEIGSNCSLDRATLNSTIIGDRVKIDNLVQIGHNVSVGDDTIIVSQTGIAGSSTIGNQVILGGQVGIANHVTIGDKVKVASKSGIPSGKIIPSGVTLSGIPAINHLQKNRIDIMMRNLVKKK